MKKAVLAMLLLLCLLLTGCGKTGGAPEKEEVSEPVSEKIMKMMKAKKAALSLLTG